MKPFFWIFSSLLRVPAFLKKDWPVLEPGTRPWWDCVQRLGVEQDSVELTLRILDNNPEQEEFGPHALWFPGDASTSEKVVTLMLLAYRLPDYGVFMYVAHRWNDAGRALRAWLASAYAWMIDEGDEKQREAALYSLWVDFFEVPNRATFMFPHLWQKLRARNELLAASGPVRWQQKRAAYKAAARDPKLHEGLAQGLAASFYDTYGNVEPIEALALFRAITIEDEQLRSSLESILFTPTRWRVVGLVTVDETDPRWRKWLPKDARPSFLIALAPVESLRWVPRSVLLHGERRLGRLRHFAFPFDEEIPHQREAVPHEGSTELLFRIEGSVDAVRAAFGEIVDSWPPGLESHSNRSRRHKI